MNRIRNFFVAALAFLLLVACGGDGGEISFSTANIQNGRLSADANGANSTTTFQPTDTVYVLADLQNAPDDTTVKAEFYALNVPGEEGDFLIDQTALTGGSSALTFTLSPPDNNWPAGDYRVDVYLNDELDQSLSYSVAGETATEAVETTEQDDSTNVADTIVAEDTASGGIISSLEDVKQATIRIQAQGSFVDPEIGEALNVAGQGSGFIIDESGIAVTNNHVVTGAAFLQVWIGDETEPRNARVLGVSECADLAVIDIEGEGYPVLEWYDGDINVGLDIYVAGYPLFGNEEYTVTRGIVSKAQANGETSWASIDAVLEVDATINGGNSGGPLVNADGQVVGVNYAGRSDTSQFFSISRDVAIPLVEQMRQSQDVQSIGINGRAVSDGQSLFGIWVSSVASGSPADAAGIRPGDIMTKLEGLVLATDGTMSSYCDILRGRDADDTMTFEVIRFNTGEVLEGQLNGRELEVVGSLGGGQADSGGDTGQTGDYTTVNDDSGQLAVNVPTSWSQVDGSAWTNSDGDTLGIRVIAAPDVNGYLNSWTTPGVSFRASSDLGMSAAELIDQFDLSSDCEYSGREQYSDQVYTGQYDIWSNCGGASTFVVLTAAPADNSYVVLLEVQILSDADVAAFQAILDSFIVQ